MSPILERKSGKFVAKKEVCFLGKKEKKAQPRERKNKKNGTSFIYW
jgi:hypothetical protein